MKKICLYFVMAIALVGMASCTTKKDKTIANLKSAINGETTASAKYAAFAEQAAKDSLFAVAALFKATSEAEALHIKNHQEVLASLGVNDFVGTAETFSVKTTAENLQSGIDGETYEFTEMYPKFNIDAEAEGVQAALVSFNYAKDAETGHAKIYGDVLSKLTTPAAIADVYYVCPKCGNTYPGSPSDICELCQTAADKFLTFKAGM